MTHEDFALWVDAHVKATGAEARLSDLLWANRHIIDDRWHATYAEMCECTQRLIEKSLVPQFPAEHTNALHRELKQLRAENERREKSKKFQETYATPAVERLEGCEFRGVCCGGKNHPQCQEVQRRWDAMMARERSAKGATRVFGE